MKRELLCFSFLAALLSGCGDSSGTSSSRGNSGGADASRGDTTRISIDTAGVGTVAEIDTAWDSSKANRIVLKRTSIETGGTGTTVSGTVCTVTKAGDYEVTGTLDDGQIVVDVSGKGLVRLRLAGASVSSSTTSPLYVRSADTVAVVLAAGTENFLTDAENYVFPAGEDEPDAALFSKEDLVLAGSGRLTVVGRYAKGIRSKDALLISGGEIDVTSAGHGIVGKNSLTISGGRTTVVSQGDGLRSTDTSSSKPRGFVYVAGGVVDVTSAKDGISAESQVLIGDGDVTIVAGGGSSASWPASDTVSRKGIKADSSIVIAGGTVDVDAYEDAIHANGKMQISAGTVTARSAHDGISAEQSVRFDGGDVTVVAGGGAAANTTAHSDGGFSPWGGSSTASGDTISRKGVKGKGWIVFTAGTLDVDACDDAVHSDGHVSVSGGTLTLSSGDDGLHADTLVAIGGDAKIDVAKSYEGIEAMKIQVEGGETKVVASDDGFNAAGGSSENGGMGGPGGMGRTCSSDYLLKISGGRIYVNASGDGLDSNGPMEVSGGTTVVSGPTDNGNGALDVGDGCALAATGGLLVASGSSGMAENAGSGSTQVSALISFGGASGGTGGGRPGPGGSSGNSVAAGTLVAVVAQDGTEIVAVRPAKAFQTLVVSSPKMAVGSSYTVYAGGSHSGELFGDLWENGSYDASGAESKGSFAVSSTTPSVSLQ